MLGVRPGAPAAAQYIPCPVSEVTTEVTTPLPDSWWQTPQIGQLLETRIGVVGGEATLMCLYRAYDTSVAVMMRAPSDSCSALGGGFQCSAVNEEQRCSDRTQDHIAWDYAGNRHWNAENLRTLCAGTANGDEPPLCFDWAMRGELDWGGGTRWEWQNALSLCAGTSNADGRIGCFGERIGRGEHWTAAIEICRRLS